MPVEIFATANCDDVVVFWRVDEPIEGCLGFAIERQTGDAAKAIVLENRIGFADAPGKPGERRPSTRRPTPTRQLQPSRKGRTSTRG